MNHSVYPVEREGRTLTFVFISDNHFGSNPIRKVVTYGKTYKFGLRYYGLGFGDHDIERGRIDDRVTTDNGDMRKVLSTVIYTLSIFFIEHPNERVLIEGSESIRNAYYQKIVRDYHNLISTRYRVEGFINGHLEFFRPNIKYDFIAVSIN